MGYARLLGKEPHIRPNRFSQAAELRNATFLLHELMHSASQGGNLDLSVDAMGDGRIDPYHEVSDLPCKVRMEGRAIPCNWRVIPCNI